MFEKSKARPGLCVLAVAMSLALAGCLTSSEVDSPTTSAKSSVAGGQNSAPVIGGSPAEQGLAGTSYSFQPQATDPDGDPLTFSVTGLPSWASFSSSTGKISGTPGTNDVGTYTGISITASDGSNSATLGPFSITVNAVALGSATLSWTPPALNTDGTPLTDLAGYRIYFGSSSGRYTETVTLNNPGLTTYVVENLLPGNWYFVSTAINAAGIESSYSNEAVKSVN